MCGGCALLPAACVCAELDVERLGQLSLLAQDVQGAAIGGAAGAIIGNYILFGFV